MTTAGARARYKRCPKCQALIRAIAESDSPEGREKRWAPIEDARRLGIVADGQVRIGERLSRPALQRVVPDRLPKGFERRVVFAELPLRFREVDSRVIAVS